MKRKAIKAMLVSALAIGTMNSNVVFAEDNNLTAKTDDSLVQTASVSKGQVINVSVNLNIRKTASTSSAIVGKMPANAKFDIISKSGTWYKIKYGNIEGYVSGDYVKIIGSSNSNETVTPPSSGSTSGVIGTGQVVNVSASLNIRQSTSTSSAIVGKMPANATFDILAKSGTWYKIKYGNIEGYVSGAYVKAVTSSGSTENGGSNSGSGSTGSGSSSSETQLNGKGQVVNVSVSLNIRKSTSTSSVIVGKMPANATFDIIAKNGTWYKVKYNNLEGYVSGDYVKVITSSGSTGNEGSTGSGNTGSGNTGSGSSETQVIGKGQVVNVSASLNIRKSTSTSSAIVGKMPANATFDILAKSGTWYKIKYGNIEGYVSGEYVKVISNSSSGSVGTGDSNTSGDNTDSGNTNNGGSNSQTPAIGKGQVVNVSVSLNIRKSTSTSSAIVGKMPANATFDILAKSGTWYKIRYDNMEGYVSGDYVKVINGSSSDTGNDNTTVDEEVLTDTYGVVYGLTANDTLNVRKAPNTQSEVLGRLILSQKVKIESKVGIWYKISYNGGYGYVSSGYIRIVSEEEGTLKDVDVEKYNKVLETMSAQIGSPYIWGGAGELITESLIANFKKQYPGQQYIVPAEFYDGDWRAFDCSGLMQWGFRTVGVNLGRNVSAQIYNGLEVNIDEIQPGDLLFYKTLTHVGMYIGDGKWIEAPKTGLNVRITTVPWNLIGRARRVI